MSARTRCPFHCGLYRHEISRAASYRRLALAGAVSYDGKRNFATLGRVAIDVARALRTQVPHGYEGNLIYRYEPAEPGAPNRRMVIYIEDAKTKTMEVAA